MAASKRPPVNPTPIGEGDEIKATLGRLKDILPDSQCPAAQKGETCNGVAHYREDPENDRHPLYVMRCPMLRHKEESERLASMIRRANNSTIEAGQTGFEGYDENRHETAKDALRAMRGFSKGRPPKIGVVMCGGTGLGKTRLLLASHLALIQGGVESHYFTAHQLADLFKRADSYNPEEAAEAKLLLKRLSKAQVLHLDDIGDIQGDERRRGFFQAGLKALLDDPGFIWAVATNCSYEEAVKHPEIGEKVMSRLADGAVVLPMKGKDQRAQWRRKK